MTSKEIDTAMRNRTPVMYDGKKSAKAHRQLMLSLGLRSMRIMVSYLHEMAVLMNEDGRTDKEMTYTCYKVDERLKKICGDKFEPWEVRYKQ